MRRFKKFHSYVSGKQLTIFELFALFIIGMGVFTLDLDKVDFWVDENPWIYESAALNSFLTGDFSPDLWETEYNGLLDPPIAKYFIGIGMSLGGHRPNSFPKWNWYQTSKVNVEAGAMPTQEILWWARIPMVVTSILGLMFATVLLCKAHSRFSALIFYMLSLTSFTIPLRQAMSEPPLIFFTFLAGLAGYKGIVSLSNGKNLEAFSCFAVFGVLNGLAAASKLNAILNLIAGVFSILFSLLWNKKTEMKRAIRLTTQLALTQIYLALFTFVAINPYLYHNPLQNMALMFVARSMTLDVQKILYSSSVIRPEDWFRIVPDRIFAQYATPFYPANFAINIILFAIGIYSIIQFLKKTSPGWEAYLMLAALALTSAIPALFSPLDWPRYYLFPVLFARIFIAIGVAVVILDFRDMTKNLRNMAGRFHDLLLSQFQKTNSQICRGFREPSDTKGNRCHLPLHKISSLRRSKVNFRIEQMVGRSVHLLVMMMSFYSGKIDKKLGE